MEEGYAETTKTAAPSELIRTFDNLDKQSQLLNLLEEKLAPVSHRGLIATSGPTDNDAPQARDRSHHISSVADIVNDNNKRLQRFINSIAV